MRRKQYDRGVEKRGEGNGKWNEPNDVGMREEKKSGEERREEMRKEEKIEEERRGEEKRGGERRKEN